jgi:hypothetical protein
MESPPNHVALSDLVVRVQAVSINLAEGFRKGNVATFDNYLFIVSVRSWRRQHGIHGFMEGSATAAMWSATTLAVR